MFVLRFVAPGLLASALCGCSGFGLWPSAGPASAAAPSISAAPPAAAPDYGQMFAGPLGAVIPEGSRSAAYSALSAALDAGQRKSWKGERGMFGYFAPSGDAGDCRTFTAVTYHAGRPQSLEDKACKSAAGDWRAP
jgi:hypothetical protein